jgi:hypothetical protein
VRRNYIVSKRKDSTRKRIGDGGAALESASLLPDIKEYIAQKILGHGLVADEPKQPAIDSGAMPGEQHLHGELVARGNALNQNFVGGKPCLEGLRGPWS